MRLFAHCPWSCLDHTVVSLSLMKENTVNQSYSFLSEMCLGRPLSKDPLSRIRLSPLESPHTANLDVCSQNVTCVGPLAAPAPRLQAVLAPLTSQRREAMARAPTRTPPLRRVAQPCTRAELKLAEEALPRPCAGAALRRRWRLLRLLACSCATGGGICVLIARWLAARNAAEIGRRNTLVGVDEDWNLVAVMRRP